MYRRTHPDVKRPYRVPLIFPALFIVIGIYVFVTSFKTDVSRSIVWVVILMLGLPVYFVLVKDKLELKFIGRFMDKFTKCVGRLLGCK